MIIFGHVEIGVEESGPLSRQKFWGVHHPRLNKWAASFFGDLTTQDTGR